MAKLTDKQRDKLIPELKLILERFHHDPQLLAKLKRQLSMAGQKVAQHSINHESFCDRFLIPNQLPSELIKLYGVSEKEMKHFMQKIGFVSFNRMYAQAYYQAFAISYLIGLEFDDINIRKLSIFMTVIKVWNGRKMRIFKRYCDPEIAKYVVNYELQGNHTYLKGGRNNFEFIDRYNVPAFEKTYGAPNKIADNLDSFTEGLRKIVEMEHSKIIQLFRSMGKAYYKVYREGKKEVTNDKYGQTYEDGDMVEQKETFSGVVERLVDKIEKNSMLKRNVVMRPEAQEVMKAKSNISSKGIQQLNDWIENEDNSEEVRYFFELLFSTLKPKNESDLCQVDVHVLVTKVTSSKKDPNMVKAKEILDHMLISVLGDKFKSLGSQRIAQLKMIAGYAMIIHMKLMLCKTL